MYGESEGWTKGEGRGPGTSLNLEATKYQAPHYQLHRESSSIHKVFSKLGEMH